MGSTTHTSTRPGAPAAGARPPLVTRPLLVRFVSTVGAAASFYLLLSAVPEYARAAGASAGTAGLTTTALTLSSVAAYLVAPALIARYGYRVALAAGLGALGAPALLLAVPSAEREPDDHVRPGARVGPQRGQRAVEPGLRRRHGLGAAGFGILAARTGYSVAFALTAAVLPAILAAAARLPHRGNT